MGRRLSDFLCPKCGLQGGNLHLTPMSKTRVNRTGKHVYSYKAWVMTHKVRDEKTGKWKNKNCYLGKKKPKLEKVS
jgi:hypothetical protein